MLVALEHQPGTSTRAESASTSSNTSARRAMSVRVVIHAVALLSAGDVHVRHPLERKRVEHT